MSLSLAHGANHAAIASLKASSILVFSSLKPISLCLPTSCASSSFAFFSDAHARPSKKNSFVFRCSNAADSEGEVSGSDTLTAEFMRYVSQSNQLWPLEYRNPTALLSPTLVVKVQMEALMRNDWPEENSGVKTAFNFSMPENVESLLPGTSRPPVTSARAWDAAERYLNEHEFRQIFDDPMYSPLLNCVNYEFISPLVFHGKEDRKALQAIKILASAKENDADRYFTYTFCLEKVKSGAFKDCWMIVGLRLGDYANV